LDSDDGFGMLKPLTQASVLATKLVEIGGGLGNLGPGAAS
jgi:hypothetical protein